MGGGSRNRAQQMDFRKRPPGVAYAVAIAFATIEELEQAFPMTRGAGGKMGRVELEKQIEAPVAERANGPALFCKQSGAAAEE